MDITLEARQPLDLLVRQYLQLVELELLSWPNPTLLRDASAQAFLFRNMFDAKYTMYRPPERYQLRVLKSLVHKIEQAIEDPEEDEISDDLTCVLSELLSTRLPSETDAAQIKSYVTYSFCSPTEHEKRVTLLESRAVIASSGTTGLRTWEAALRLGAYLSTPEGRSFVKDKNILELGAGTGLISILCARHLVARYVLATDGDAGVSDALNTNLFLNDLEGGQNIRTGVLRWGHNVEDLLTEHMQDSVVDVVLGADITYDASVIPSLLATFLDLFRKNAALQVLMSATVRNPETFEVFTHGCNRHNISLEYVNTEEAVDPEQKGPFYPTNVPIRVMRLSMSGCSQSVLRRS
ncbi:hypothetical protein K402DRAFT_329240 [Aulographum hederae CBS 113979]|uniref:Uncharacterized protein n=1 Tax=Aulographum hederae CBS 113979 TaxID=1176131 RepID=A0A6G1H3V0_9PEZI|nr:hypothetical protein K402DRAFT_329240 [Aulographum hederae CBS 113979]